MGGGTVIIIDPNKVKTQLSKEDAIARLREAADQLEAGDLDLESETASE